MLQRACPLAKKHSGAARRHGHLEPQHEAAGIDAAHGGAGVQLALDVVLQLLERHIAQLRRLRRRLHTPWMNNAQMPTTSIPSV